LLEMGAGESFLRACQDGNLGEVKRLVKGKKLDVNKFKDFSGMFGIHFAVERGFFDVLIYLIEHGADVNCRNNEQKTPLHLASVMFPPNMEIIMYLVDHGADIDAKDTVLDTPLLLAASVANAEVVQYLIGKGANVAAANLTQRNMLHCAALGGNMDLVRCCVEQCKGFDVNAKTTDGFTPLFMAVDKNNFEVVQYLVNLGADINAVDSFGRSPLLYAAKQSFVELAKYLVDKGADVNHKDNEGSSILHWAVFSAQPEITQYLIAHGADLKATVMKDGKPTTALDLAVSSVKTDTKYSAIVDILSSASLSVPS